MHTIRTEDWGSLEGGEMDRSKNAVKLMIEFVVCDRDMSQL